MKNQKEKLKENRSSSIHENGRLNLLESLSRSLQHDFRLGTIPDDPAIITESEILNNKIVEASPSLFDYVEKLPKYSRDVFRDAWEKRLRIGEDELLVEDRLSDEGKDFLDKQGQQEAENDIRKYYTDKIIVSLKWLSFNHEKVADSLPYIGDLLKDLKEYKDKYFVHSYSSFISALYDALVFNDSWRVLEKRQFQKIYEIITSLNAVEKMEYKDIDKAINDLEGIGLDTTPF